MKFEPVYEVTEYYDGPRCGVASFNGTRYEFRSRYLDATEYKGDYESVDIFELTPVERAQGPRILATGEFRPVANQPEPAPGQPLRLEVSWQAISDMS